MKIQERCCHGFNASSCSQRQIVEADALVTPRWTTSRWSSAREKRESGSPCVAGSSQASAFTSATCSGGKTARAARALAILQAHEPLFEEPLPPAADDPRRRLQPTRDLRRRLPLGRVQDHLRPHDHLVRKRVARNPTLQLDALLATQLDHVSAPASHIATDSTPEPRSLPGARTEFQDACTSSEQLLRERGSPAALDELNAGDARHRGGLWTDAVREYYSAVESGLRYRIHDAG